MTKKSSCNPQIVSVDSSNTISSHVAHSVHRY